MRGGTIFFAAIFAKLCLKQKLYGFHLAGMLLIISGLALGGVSNFIFGANTLTSTKFQ